MVVKDTPYRIDEFLYGNGNDSLQLYQNVYQKVKKRGNNLKFILFYLSPGDYHRYHSAALCTTDFRRHIAGKLYPVKPAYVENHPNVFKQNERVALSGEWAGGFFSTTFIGATNVGSIVLNFDEDLKTNLVKDLCDSVKDRYYDNSQLLQIPAENKYELHYSEDDVIDYCSESGSVDGKDMNSFTSDERTSEKVQTPTSTRSSGSANFSDKDATKIQTKFDFKTYQRDSFKSYRDISTGEKYSITDQGLVLEKGQEIGYFNLGSSIMLIFEAAATSEFDVKIGQKVQLGTSILRDIKTE